MYGQSYARLPLGVAILSILIGIFGAFVLAIGLLGFLLGLSAGAAAGVGVLGLPGTIASLVVLLIGGVILAVAAGLWDQELWALALALIVLIFYGALQFLSADWLPFVVDAVLVAYLVAVSSEFS
jgi:hypothetical protein